MLRLLSSSLSSSWGARALARVHARSVVSCTSSSSTIGSCGVQRVPLRNQPSRGLSALVLKPHYDFRHIRDNLDLYKRNIVDRQSHADAERVVALYKQCNDLQFEIDEMRSRRNRITSGVGAAKTPDERAALIAEGRQLKDTLAQRETELEQRRAELDTEASRLPNLTHPSTPIGPEGSGRVLRYIGTKPEFAFAPLDHVALSLAHDLVDFEQAAIVSGSRFYYLKHELAMMELALVQWSMQKLIARGFTPILPPDLVHNQFIYGTGFQPRDTADVSQIYQLQPQHDLSLVGTAEIPLCAMFTQHVLHESDLPKRIVAFGHAFRTEAGGMGQVNRGLYRVHQFSKVEMFAVTSASDSERMFDELVALQEEMFGELGLHCRVLEIPSGDLGAPAARKIDIETWIPSRNDYGEISSTSTCTDYQSRRLDIRYRSPSPRDSTKTSLRYAHTLNGTACAVPRMLLAIVEQCQQADHSIRVPDVLRPWMMGIERVPAPPPLFPTRKSRDPSAALASRDAADAAAAASGAKKPSSKKAPVARKSVTSNESQSS